jgi:hypothetical protein
MQTRKWDPSSLYGWSILYSTHYFVLSGQRLLRKADFHLGQHINTFFRIRCKMSENFADKKHLQGAEKRHITMFGMYVTDSYTSDCCLCSWCRYSKIVREVQFKGRTSAIQVLQESAWRMSDYWSDFLGSKTQKTYVDMNLRQCHSPYSLFFLDLSSWSSNRPYFESIYHQNYVYISCLPCSGYMSSS